ncbi:hypothetical protein [Arthrobacter sp. JSM 101049]|uniref:hypothetical protein n=1 Tax=Arthrobacter sp. JSM 101049 TaxID=929097 RepID=UPI0035621B93
MELPAGWRQLEAAGISYVACHTGHARPAAATGNEDASWLAGDALPVTVNGLDILMRRPGGQALDRPRGAAGAGSLVALEYRNRDILGAANGLYVIDIGSAGIGGYRAQRMDLTHRGDGVALFTRRWVLSAGARTLEIAATCPLDLFGRYIQDFNELEDRIHITP